METYAAIAALIILVAIGVGIYLAGPEKWMPGNGGKHVKKRYWIRFPKNGISK